MIVYHTRAPALKCSTYVSWRMVDATAAPLGHRWGACRTPLGRLTRARGEGRPRDCGSAPAVNTLVCRPSELPRYRSVVGFLCLEQDYWVERKMRLRISRGSNPRAHCPVIAPGRSASGNVDAADLRRAAVAEVALAAPAEALPTRAARVLYSVRCPTTFRGLSRRCQLDGGAASSCAPSVTLNRHSDGFVVNALGERCDEDGRLTRARGKRAGKRQAHPRLPQAQPPPLLLRRGEPEARRSVGPRFRQRNDPPRSDLPLDGGAPITMGQHGMTAATPSSVARRHFEFFFRS